jgi:ABC-type transporter Mla subunit MlaD
MNKAVILGSGVLALAVGCGGAGEETVIKEQVALMKEMAAAYEKVTDADSLKQAQTQVDKLQQKAQELQRKVDSWPEEKKKQVNQKYGAELAAAADRLETARAKALKKTAGG